jgi:type II secretory pathway component PulF
MSHSARNIFWASLIGTAFVMSALVWAIFDSGAGIALLFLGLLLLPIPFLLSSAHGPLTRVSSNMLGLALLVPAIVALLIFSVGNPVVIVFCLIFIGVIFVLALILRTNRAVRRRRAMVVLAYLEQAVRANLPLPRMLIAAQAGESGAIAARLRSLRRKLESGASITEALDHSLRELPRRSLGLIAAAERIGQLPQVLDRLIREDGRRDTNDMVESAFISVYPLMMCAGIFIITSMIMIYVIPKFEQIFKDFRVDLPWITVLMMQFSRSAGIFLAPVIMLAMVIFVFSAIRNRFWPSREVSGNWIGRFSRHRDLADACGVVADSLGAGLGLDAAIRSAAELPVNTLLRWKLYRWAGGIEQGLSNADAARRARMPQLLIGLSATADLSTADEVFHFLQRYYAARFSRFAALMRGAIVPLTVFFFAIIVAAIALALYLPMIQLINTTAPYRTAL